MNLCFTALLASILPAIQALNYDYIVIGGGTGCVRLGVHSFVDFPNFQGHPSGLTVASRLAEDKDKQVLVIEAGPNAENLQEVIEISPLFRYKYPLC
jgi:hypothetical protein